MNLYLKFKINTKSFGILGRYIVGLLGLGVLTASCSDRDGVESRNLSSQLNSADCPWSQGQNWRDTIELINAPRQISADLLKLQTFALNKNLTPEMLKQDLSCLKLIFQTSYSGANYFNTLGVNLAANLEAIAESIHEEMSRFSFLQTLIPIHDGAYDGHLSYDYSSYVHRWSIPGLSLDTMPQDFSNVGAYFSLPQPIFSYIDLKFYAQNDYFIAKNDEGSEISITTCEGMKAVVALSNHNETYFSFVGHFSPRKLNTTCYLTTGGLIELELAYLNSEPQTDRPDKGFTVDNIGGIEYLKIFEFPTFEKKEQIEYAERLSNRDIPLIIDLRGQGGGGNPFAKALLNSLFTKTQNYKYLEQHSFHSLINLARIKKVYEEEVIQAQILPLEDESKRSEFIAAAETNLDGWNSIMEARVEAYQLKDINSQKIESESSETSGTRSKEYKNKIIIIADKGCGSQCEFFIAELRHHPQVTIIGAPTAGRLVFASNNYIDLPHSGIRMMNSTRITKFEPEVIEGEGIEPDLYVLHSDPKNLAIEMLNSYKK